ncbi:MAG: hypothetical protein K2X43_13215 [Hyphomonadaceae bacterium]|nr:hypothetical protein [Hyphomonadaceae bacterium]
MTIDTLSHLQDYDGAPAFEIQAEPLLLERLQAIGLIEPDGVGGWQVRQSCQDRQPVFQDDTDAPPPPAAIRPWRPRTL